MSLKNVKPFKQGTDVLKRLEKRVKLWPSSGNQLALREYRDELAKVGQDAMDKRFIAPPELARKGN